MEDSSGASGFVADVDLGLGRRQVSRVGRVADAAAAGEYVCLWLSGG